MNEEEIIEILKNVICDEVIGTYCLKIQKEGVNCSKNCKDDDCYLIKAVEGIIDLYTKEKEKNKELRNKMKNAENNLKVAISKTIQKSKIREKIGELNNSEWIEDRIAIPYLKELLED